MTMFDLSTSRTIRFLLKRNVRMLKWKIVANSPYCRYFHKLSYCKKYSAVIVVHVMFDFDKLELLKTYSRSITNWTRHKLFYVKNNALLQNTLNRDI